MTRTDDPEEKRGGRVERWARHPAAPMLLGLFAALEACIFPAPTEVLMAALSLAQPRRSWRFAAIALGGSVLGALIGYAIGYLAHGNLGWGAELGRLDAVGRQYRAGAFWVLATSGFTPVPHLVYTIAGGIYRVPLIPFVTGTFAGRALNYLLLGFVVRVIGPHLRRAMRLPGVWMAVALSLLLLAVVYLRVAQGGLR